MLLAMTQEAGMKGEGCLIKGEKYGGKDGGRL